MSRFNKKPPLRSNQEDPDSSLSRSMSMREAHLREQMAEMEEFYKKKLSDAKLQQIRVEDELKSFKDRMAGDLSASLDAAEDTQNMTSPVNMTRLQEMYHHLRVNKWPKVRRQLQEERQISKRAQKIIQDVFKEAVSRTDSVKKELYAIFTETKSQKELPKKVQDHLRCSLNNLQLALFHSNKQDLRSAAVKNAPEVCRELLSELFWLFSLMALNKTPLQPQWDSLSATDSWDCFPVEFTTHFAREDQNKPSVGQLMQTPRDVVQHQPTPLDPVFARLHKDIVAFVKEQLTKFRQILTSERSSENPRENTPERGWESSREAVDFLRRMDQELAERLRRLLTVVKHKEENPTKPSTAITRKEDHPRSKPTARVSHQKLKTLLQQKFSQVCEGGATAGNPAPLKEIYSELDITEMYQEHGVRKPADSARAFENIFKQRSESGEPIRTVLTVGVAGVGKTVLTQKISLDWAEGRVFQDIELLFPFTFRELNELKDKSFSLEGLLQHFFNGSELRSFADLQLLFIFDGLDECRLPLDFTNTKVLTDPSKSTSVEELLVNLIRGKLLPSARLWISTRPEAANQVPAEGVSMVTEVRGFTDPQREQFFRKRFRDEEATAVITHIKNNPSLRIMSRSPDVCWIIYNFRNKKQEPPMTLTSLYIHFLQENLLRNSTSEKDSFWSSETEKILQTVGKLAFEEVKKGNLAFYVSDLSSFNLDDSQVACFTRPNMKELLAALHVRHIFFSSGENLLSPHYTTEAGFYQSAVDWSLQCPNGHLDMFLPFLLGLSLSTNQKLLKGLVSDRGNDQIIQETIKHIHMKLNLGLSAERSLNLLHCLNELNDRSLLEETQKIMRERGLFNKQMSSSQWSALCFLLLSSDSHLEEFDLKKFCPSQEGLQKLLPVVKASRKADLSFCDLIIWSSKLSSVLSSSTMTHLDLSNNDLRDSGVKALCKELKRLNSRLTTLSLSSCGMTPGSCSSLASVLSSTSLAHLDLSNNDLQDLGVEWLCEGLKGKSCRLETLRLSGCMVSEVGGASLASALSSSPSRLRELDLRYNDPGASADRLTALRAPHGPLHSLRLDHAGAQFLTDGLTKYFCELFLDPNTADKRLKFENNNCTVKFMSQALSSSAPSLQVLCSPELSGRCFWKVELNLTHKASIYIAVTYSGKRDSEFGQSPHSWALRVTTKKYTVHHDGKSALLPHTAPYVDPARLAVYLDYEAGYVSFYKDYHGILDHLHTFHTTFTEPVRAGFKLRDCNLSLVP